MASSKLLLISCLLGIFLREARGHGIMLDPVSRSTAWRMGYPVERNYNDNQLFCGGRKIQFEENDGKCGECGDNYAMPRPRPNENGGIYGTGVIVRKYNAENATVNVWVKLTANHMGSFAFDLCPLNETRELETEECFNRYPLQLTNGDERVKVYKKKMDYEVSILLPSNVTCDHCVFRWTYKTGNSWGHCDDGTVGLGCGDQETFRNCADVSIL